MLQRGPAKGDDHKPQRASRTTRFHYIRNQSTQTGREFRSLEPPQLKRNGAWWACPRSRRWRIHGNDQEDSVGTARGRTYRNLLGNAVTAFLPQAWFYIGSLAIRMARGQYANIV